MIGIKKIYITIHFLFHSINKLLINASLPDGIISILIHRKNLTLGLIKITLSFTMYFICVLWWFNQAKFIYHVCFILRRLAFYKIKAAVWTLNYFHYGDWSWSLSNYSTMAFNHKLPKCQLWINFFIIKLNFYLDNKKGIPHNKEYQSLLHIPPSNCCSCFTRVTQTLRFLFGIISFACDGIWHFGQFSPIK